MAGPCAVVDGLVVAAGLLGEFEEEGEDVLGDRVGAVAGDIDDGDVAAACGGGATQLGLTALAVYLAVTLIARFIEPPLKPALGG